MRERSVDKECGKIKNYLLRDEKRTVLCVYFMSIKWYDEYVLQGRRNFERNMYENKSIESACFCQW